MSVITPRPNPHLVVGHYGRRFLQGSDDPGTHKLNGDHAV